MGLILTKYVQDLALLKQDTWEGKAVFLLTMHAHSAIVQLNTTSGGSVATCTSESAGVLSNEADLEAYFHEYLVSPLVARAVESSDNSNSNASTDPRY